MNQKCQRSVLSYHNANYQYISVNFKDQNDGAKMHGSQRVIMFCLLTTILPTTLIVSSLYLRNIRYADVMYKISDSDVIQIHKGQSSIFCEKHSLKMNNTFNAFQMKGRPELSNKTRHIKLRKSMKMPDDTLEYWGFFLFAGATVELKACSRYEGSKILVVKGDKILNTCGILDGSKYRKDPSLIDKQGQVSVTLENLGKKGNDVPLLEKKHENVGEQSNEREDIQDNLDNKHSNKRQKRSGASMPLHNPNTVLDTGVYHGGNANNATNISEDASVSSFENNLHECYNDNILMNNFFPYSKECNSTNYLENTTILKVEHKIQSDGYYYYIFYSDNDLVNNDIHAIFDIYKPTFQYANMSDTKVCLNSTECEFDISIFSDELVIVEVPTTDGFKNDKSFILTSVCHPRTSVYIIFPVSVLLLILLFAFL
ncbi:PREDICTED: uncharacterized protein LOC106118213 isoform X1 [Papilio xuthus]|uniref:Uncharacterized protein LOC106118213 isoform X1 n=2 Tax=Papilio xuthus TaxID=66420 RepID=A0AAJ7E9L8_PAPXU|nr:PREDICTED: uncharacterized protein LOC106118213 isoform X1 [Papilio xuthus]